MKTIVLVSCGKRKLSKAAPAKEMYTSPRFRMARAYAERIGDDWRILSAKYGLLKPDEVIEPYDETVVGKPIKERRIWAVTVRNSISCNLLTWTHGNGKNWRCDPVRFVCLAGEAYLQCFDIDAEAIRKFCVIEKPLEGMGIGKQMQFLSQGSRGARNDSRSGESVPGGAPAAPLRQKNR
jgi:hypothetical protein